MVSQEIMCTRAASPGTSFHVTYFSYRGALPGTRKSRSLENYGRALRPENSLLNMRCETTRRLASSRHDENVVLYLSRHLTAVLVPCFPLRGLRWTWHVLLPLPAPLPFASSTALYRHENNFQTVCDARRLD